MIWHLIENKTVFGAYRVTLIGDWNKLKNPEACLFALLSGHITTQ